MDGWVQLTKQTFETHEGVEELNRMLRLLYEVMPGDGDQVRIYKGYGAPTIAAGDGSLYQRLDGGASTTLYVMESGTWTAK